MDIKLRVLLLVVDLKLLCFFFVYIKECFYVGFCCELVMRENDLVYVIKMENEYILVWEFFLGFMVGDFVWLKYLDMNFFVVDLRFVNDNGLCVKVNYEFVDIME